MATISGHHGVPRPSSEVRRASRRVLREAKAWVPVQQQIVDELALEAGVGALPELAAVDGAVLVAVAGLVSISDWIASDAARFPVTDGKRPGSKQLATEAVRDAAWSVPLVPEGQDFPGLFGRSPRATQAALIEALGGLDLPALVIVEDRTGAGKTEAALWVAYRGLTSGARGLYVGMPTRATAAQLHGRVRRFVTRLWPSGSESVRLLHGGVHLDEDVPFPSGVGIDERDAARRRGAGLVCPESPRSPESARGRHDRPGVTQRAQCSALPRTRLGSSGQGRSGRRGSCLRHLHGPSARTARQLACGAGLHCGASVRDPAGVAARGAGRCVSLGLGRCCPYLRAVETDRVARISTGHVRDERSGQVDRCDGRQTGPEDHPRRLRRGRRSRSRRSPSAIRGRARRMCRGRLQHGCGRAGALPGAARVPSPALGWCSCMPVCDRSSVSRSSGGCWSHLDRWTTHAQCRLRP